MGKDQGKARILLTGDYPVLESAFFKEVKAAREREPFNPFLILVSSKLLGLHLCRLQKNQEVRNRDLLLN